ncbi:MAG: hypothetical protein HC857_13050 [Synechococcales cyanobacterium RU_4_20]|nr:hypothetical protein [Synechococcales cyanobacterium RU_4_20]
MITPWCSILQHPLPLRCPFQPKPFRDRDRDALRLTLQTLPAGTLRQGETLLQPGDTWSAGTSLTYTPPAGSTGVIEGFR